MSSKGARTLSDVGQLLALALADAPRRGLRQRVVAELSALETLAQVAQLLGRAPLDLLGDDDER